MTSASPLAVKYEFDADYLDGDQWKPLPVELIRPSVDADRVPYAHVQMTLAGLDEETFEALDPRTLPSGLVGQVRWRMRQLDSEGNVLGYLPRAGENTNEYAVMHVRSISRTLQSVTLTLHGAENLVDDKLCLLPLDGPGPSATKRTLINWILELIMSRARPGTEFPDRVIAADEHAAAVLDDRHAGWAITQMVKFGESYLAAIETELNSHDVRLVDAWGLAWYVASRGIPPTYADAPDIVKLSTFTSDDTHTLPDDVDPIVTGLEQTVSRDGQWADAVVLSGETGDGLYVTKWRQTAGLGEFNLSLYLTGEAAAATFAVVDAHTRGRIIAIDRAAPSGNLAESIASRALVRGHEITVTALARFDVLPGMTLEVHLRDIVLTGTILAVAWDTASGSMTIRAQSVTTAPEVISSDEKSTDATAIGKEIDSVLARVTNTIGTETTKALEGRGQQIAAGVRNRKWTDV